MLPSQFIFFSFPFPSLFIVLFFFSFCSFCNNKLNDSVLVRTRADLGMFALFRLGVTLGKTSNSDKGVKEVLATGGELDSDEGKTLAPDGEDGVTSDGW